MPGLSFKTFLPGVFLLLGMWTSAESGTIGKITGQVIDIEGNPLPVEPDRTTTKYIVRADDIEALSIVRSMDDFIELQAGVTVDEEGEGLTIRAGDAEDVAYYLDGVPIPSTDHVRTQVYRDFNRLAVQEMTVVTGGMDAEYGNAQGGIVSVVTRDGGHQVQGMLDYQITLPGKKHWGQNVYDSNIHRGHNRWDDPEWASETVTLPDARRPLPISGWTTHRCGATSWKATSPVRLPRI